MDPNKTVTIGSRVAYEGNLEDKGTIVNILLDEYPFVVKWDHSKNADETVDQFKGNELVLLDD